MTTALEIMLMIADLVRKMVIKLIKMMKKTLIILINICLEKEIIVIIVNGLTKRIYLTNTIMMNIRCSQ